MSRSSTLFARFSLDYADHPKIQCLSDAAFRAHVEMILYARRYMTDGRIPKRFAKRFATESLTELLSNDEANPSVYEGEDGDYWLHGFADMQETRDEIQTRRLVNAENGRRGGLARKRVAKRTASESLSEGSSEIKAETETETETEKTSSSPNADASEDGREDVDNLCHHLAERIVNNGNKPPTITVAWKRSARLMLDRDDRDQTEAHRLIDWCQADSFWMSNILSMPKFREKYDQLRLRAGAVATRVIDDEDDWEEPVENRAAYEAYDAQMRALEEAAR